MAGPYTQQHTFTAETLTAALLNAEFSAIESAWSGIVVTTGAQTIAGVKTFTSIPVLPSSDPTADNHAVRKYYVDHVSPVPSGETILFYKDIAVLGYTLLDTLDNKTVYVTKGSAAGGETGGGIHSSGQWTITGITGPSHNHNWYNYQGEQLHAHSYNSGGSAVDVDVSVQSGGFKGVQAIAATGETCLYDSYYTTTSGTGACASTGAWRPAAYCCTLQTRI